MDALSNVQTYVPPVGIVRKKTTTTTNHSFTSLLLILYLSPLSAIHRFRLKTPSRDAKIMKINHVHSGHQTVTSTPEIKNKKRQIITGHQKANGGFGGIRTIALCQVYCML